MNFYPIYRNKKLLPWIKWWLIKGNKVTPKHLSEWIDSAEAITLTGVYKGSPLLYLNLKGNTSQTGTPSPEASVPVNVVKEDNYININDNTYRVDLGGKNKLKPLRAVGYSATNNGITYTWLEGGAIHVQGTATANSNNQIANNTQEGLRELLLSGNYYLSGSPVGSSSTTYRIQLYGYRDNGTGFLYADNGLKVNTFVNTSKAFNISIFVANGQTVDFIVYPQLEEGNRATEYSPYTDNPIELNKIGNYQDKIYYDSGKWYIEKNIGKVVLNGQETWSSGGSGTNAFWYTNILSSYISGIPKENASLFCTHFKYGGAGNPPSSAGATATSIFFNVSSGTTVLNGNMSIPKTNYSAVNDLKNELATNTPTLYYPLATPTYTEITESTLISQLEAIYNAKLQSGTNTITQTPSDLPFYLNFRYYEKG